MSYTYDLHWSQTGIRQDVRCLTHANIRIEQDIKFGVCNHLLFFDESTRSVEDPVGEAIKELSEIIGFGRVGVNQNNFETHAIEMAY